MSIKAPFTDLDVKTSDSGFYEGNSVSIALISKGIMVALVLWALILPENANKLLGAWNGSLLKSFNSFYIIATGFFAFFLFALAVIPSTGKRKLGMPDDEKEFSNFSWFSMMFGAGLGVGLMVYATAEPMGLWGSNPVVIAGDVAANQPEALGSAFRYTFLHYGFHAWAIYVVTGLSLAYYAFSRGMPLTIRAALTPLFGKLMNGILGDIVDILGVVATILGVSVTIGFGVSQLVDGIYAITDMAWLMDLTGKTPKPSSVGLIAALLMIMVLSIISAVSGVGRGVKYLSNLNLVLSLILLGTFAVFGSFAFALSTYASAFIDYIMHFASLSFGAYDLLPQADFVAALPEAVKALPAADVSALYSGATNPWGTLSGFEGKLPESFAALDGSSALAASIYESGTQGRQFAWQAAWTTFYWAWWIAFSPFVGLFLARISKGRSIREFIVGCVFAPALVCFAWMTILGASAMNLEMNGTADGAIIAASTTNKLFATLQVMLVDNGALLSGITVMSVVLILTFLVTSADSGILVMNTIMSGGEQETGIKHRIVWGVVMTAVIGTLLVAGGGGLDALKNAMIIGALPFAMVMVLMCISLTKALIRDGIRDRHEESQR